MLLYDQIKKIGVAANPLNGNLAGQILNADVYKISGNATLNGTLTLQGNSNSVFVFIVEGDLSIRSLSKIEIGSIDPKNIWWVCVNGYAVTLEKEISFIGNLISEGKITSDGGNAGWNSLLSNKGPVNITEKFLKPFISIYSNNELGVIRNPITNNLPCYSEELFRGQVQKLPESMQLYEQRSQSYMEFLNRGVSTVNDYVIPVVVHVVHGGQPIGTGANIPDAQIFNAIDVLNREFSDAAFESGIGTDTRIQFCLAQNTYTPSFPLWTSFGSSTPGITRIADGSGNNVDPQNSSTLMSLQVFPPNRYLNIWVVTNISDPNLPGVTIGGFATMPPISFTQHGIVVRYDYFGNIANSLHPLCVGCNLNAVSENNVLVHEVGHYLGLYHPFDGGCGFDPCLSGDLVCDTPPTNVGTFGCPSPAPSYCGQPIDLQNFMEYTDESCKSRFTIGQRDRMQFSINQDYSNLVSASNLSFTGVACLPFSALFTADLTQVCENNPVVFEAIFAGPATYTWNFGDGSPLQTFSNNNPINYTYNSAGTYTVTLTVDDGSSSISNSILVYVSECTPFSTSQGHWYFGNQAGLDFSNGMGQVDFQAYLNNTIISVEAAITQLDPTTNNLSFYAGAVGATNLRVWNNTHSLMPNGSSISGSFTSSGGGISIPHPNQTSFPNHYYLFTTAGAGDPNNGTRYNIIDMGTPGGTVLLPTNNLYAIPPGALLASDGSLRTGEIITAIPKCNGIDYWLILVAANTDPTYAGSFFVFEVTSSGISFSNSFSVGPPSGTSTFQVGSLRASPNSQRLAFNAGGFDGIRVYDFDPATGIISNPTVLTNTYSGLGCSFSPNSNILYASNGFAEIMQFDLLSSNPGLTAQIINQVPPPSSFFGQMQLGPDNRIYIASSSEPFVKVINFPDNLNSPANPNNAGYNPIGINLAPAGEAIWSELGLPNIINARPALTITPDFTWVINNCYQVSFNGPPCMSSYSWSFPGATPSTSTSQNPVVTYTADGTYTVTLTVVSPTSGSSTITHTFTLGIDPPEFAGPTCVSISVGNPFDNYSVINPIAGYIYDWQITGPNPFTANNTNNVNVDWGGIGGTITLTATDANTGCSSSITLTVNAVASLPVTTVSTSDPTCFGNCDGSATANVTGGAPGYTYDFYDDQGVLLQSGSSSTINTLCAGNYLVNVTDQNGCISQTLFTINPATLNPPPVADISTDVCKVMGQTVAFTNDEPFVSGYTYNWNFGIGEGTGTGYNVTHTYNEPGTYIVALLITDACGNNDLDFLTINIYENICACDVSAGGGTAYTLPNSTVLLSGTSTWTGTMSVQESMIISTGANLIIDANAVIKFGPFGRIIVEDGATLQIKSGAILTSLDAPCELMWKGIEVWGVSTQPGSSTAQGSITVESGATIEKAHTAILMGATKECIYNPVPFFYCSNGYDYSKSGGKLNIPIGNTFFNSNGVGIKILNGASDGNGHCTVEGTDFSGGVLIDARYNSANANPYPNTANPFNAVANPQGRQPKGIYQTNTKGIKFNKLLFDDIDMDMESYDSKYDVTNSEFFNSRYGIRIFNSVTTAILNHNITANSFFDIKDPLNTTNTAGIQIEGGRYDKINRNIFRNTIQNLQSNFPNGIYTENVSNFNIIDNEFEFLTFGIITIGSSTGGGMIGPAVDGVSKNVFTGVYRSDLTVFNNSKLKIRCNQYDNSTLPGQYLRNWANIGNLANQGQVPPSSVPPSSIYYNRYPAGNLFNPSGFRQINTALFFPYTYHRHNDPSLIGLTPIPANLIVNNTGINYSSTNSCRPVLEILNPGLSKSMLVDMEDDINELLIEKSALQSQLDGGNTQLLLDAIAGGMSNGQLKNLLLQNWPLSDEVVLAFIEKQNVPNGHFKQVMEQNMPVARSVYPDLAVKLDALPPGIANQLRPLQIYNPDYRTVAAIDDDIMDIEVNRTDLLNQLVNYYLDTNQVDTALLLLEDEFSIDADQQLAGVYLYNGDATNAASKITSVPTTEEELQQWNDLYNLYLDLINSNRSIFELTAQEEQLVRDMANSDPYYLAITNAKAVLRKVFGEDFPLYLPEENQLQSMWLESETTEETDDVEVYPNPANEIVFIKTKIETTDIAEINIYDITGKLILSQPLKNNLSAVDIHDLAQGVYSIRVTINSENVSNNKLVIAK